jgi:hypothetical protein
MSLVAAVLITVFFGRILAEERVGDSADQAHVVAVELR